MAKGQCHFTVIDRCPSPITVSDGTMPDGNFVIGWGMSETDETLIVMFSPGDGESTLKASVTCYFPKVTPELLKKLGRRR